MCINYALLGFYLCRFERYECVKRLICVWLKKLGKIFSNIYIIMLEQTEQCMHDITIYDDLITSLITLKVILEEIDKISKAIDLEINNKIKN